MNQINIDSLLNIGNSTKIEPQLKLDSSQLYQALLKIGTDGNGQMQVQTPAGPVKVQLSPQDAQQIRQATGALQSNNPNTANETQVSLSRQAQHYQSSQATVSASPTPGATNRQSSPTNTTYLQVKLQQSSEQAFTLQVMKPSQQLQLSEQALFKLLQQAVQMMPSSMQAKSEQQISLAVQLSRSEQKILLQLMGNRASIALPISVFQASDRSQLLQQLPDTADLSRHSSRGNLQKNAVLQLIWQQGQMHLKLQMMASADEKGLSENNRNPGSAVEPNLSSAKPQTTAQTNSQNPSARFGKLDSDAQTLGKPQDPAKLPGPAKLPDAAKLQGQAAQAANDISESAPTRAQRAVADHKFSATGNVQTAQSTDVNTSPSTIREKNGFTAQTPSPSQSNATAASLLASIDRDSIKTLLPLLGKLILPKDLKVQGQQVQLTSNTAATASHWQIKAEGAHWQLEVTEPNPLTSLKISSLALDKPVQWQISAQAPLQKLSDAAKAVDVPLLWRQLLPLQQTLASLEPTADLPMPVQAVLQELRGKMLDAQKIAQIPEVQAQLNASLQFSPLPTQPNPLTAAGSMAIALQLLLGRLTSTESAKNNPAKDKLQQLIGQLSESQSSQLVRQLAGHSSSMQQAQLASFEHLQNKPEQNQFYLQLPLVVQGQSQFVELAIAEREAQNSPEGLPNKAWQLTMKFNLGQDGHLLVQVQLEQNKVAMNFYADSDPTQQLTKQWLPQLMERLQAQGLEVTEAQVQRGKIPEHLYQRGTSLLQIKV